MTLDQLQTDESEAESFTIVSSKTLNHSDSNMATDKVNRFTDAERKELLAASQRDRSEQRDLQNLCQRLLELVGAAAGVGLMQSAWFRRGITVKEDATDNTADMNGNSAASSNSLASTPSESMNTPSSNSVALTVDVPSTSTKEGEF